MVVRVNNTIKGRRGKTISRLVVEPVEEEDAPDQSLEYCPVPLTSDEAWDSTTDTGHFPSFASSLYRCTAFPDNYRCPVTVL